MVSRISGVNVATNSLRQASGQAGLLLLVLCAPYYDIEASRHTLTESLFLPLVYFRGHFQGKGIGGFYCG